jgi:hypothetical protein
LAAGIRSDGPEAIRGKLALLIGILPSPITDNSDPELIILAYQAALSDLPAWAVEEACDASLKGKIGNFGGRYRPSPGELHVYAENLVMVFLKEKRDLDKILAAEVIDDSAESVETRKQMTERIKREVGFALKANGRYPHPLAKDSRDADAERAEALQALSGVSTADMPAPRISDSLRASLARVAGTL